MRRAGFFLLAALFVAETAFAGAGKIVILNADAPNVGFNDPTPVAPVGGNTGTTLGQQRLNVFEEAARHYTKILDTNVDVIVSATFTNIPGCTANDAILGQAGPLQWRHSFTNAPRANVWYPIALANKFAGHDLDPARADIVAQFNSAVDNATCLGASDWYYGFDNQHGADVNLYLVVLHELAHGLGFSSPIAAPGFKDNVPSVFDTHAIDTTLGLRWEQMTEQQRFVSMTNGGKLAWDGTFVREAMGRYLDPVTNLKITAPAAITGMYEIGNASFGANAGSAVLTGSIAAPVDAANTEGPTTTDGCTAYENAGAVNGKIALVDRGTCTFVTKARNAQSAGATAVVIVDNSGVGCTPPGMGGDDAEITIPVISVSTGDGAAIRAQLTGGQNVVASLHHDATKYAGETGDGYLRLYAPCVVEPGSSIYHWDTVAQPNLLMEPQINGDLEHDLDLTMHYLLDIGWTTRTGRRMLKR
jgi:hypothetical protein